MKPMSLIDEPGIQKLIKVAQGVPAGDFVEIGVFKGGSAWYLDMICENQGRTLHLFDTFEGMPYSDAIDVCPVGMFKGDHDEVSALFPKAKIYMGVFPETLPDDLMNIAFIHVDCDQYRTAKAAVELMPPRMVSGGIMYIDDYGNIPGVKKAVDAAFKVFDVPAGGRAIWRKR